MQSLRGFKSGPRLTFTIDRRKPPNRSHPAHGFTLLEIHEIVSYLLIKPHKSLTNKDFTGKSLFLKDLEKINR